MARRIWTETLNVQRATFNVELTATAHFRPIQGWTFDLGRSNVRPLPMSDSSYRKIAVASAFSPRFEQVLAEAKRARDRFGAELCLIYVGKKDDSTSKRFADALAEMELPADSAIHYHQGSPADAILEAIHANEVELIVAGALEKEVVLRPFLGN